MISHDELLHLKMQAEIREHNIPKTEIKYIGPGEGTHWYLIANKHSVPVNMIEEFERVDDVESDPV